jgi:GTP-binding protein
VTTARPPSPKKKPRARKATFLLSAAKPADFPAPSDPEIAFAGRSNVGKSSLINALCGVDGLARTSRTPGRTQLLNWFTVEPPAGAALAFVDLPGYGYAKVPTSMQASWQGLIESYLGKRPALRGVVLLVDVRRGAEQEEEDLIAWLGERAIPVIVVVTKIDKMSKHQREPLLAAVKRTLTLPRLPIGFSAQDGEGVDDLWRAIAKVATTKPS